MHIDGALQQVLLLRSVKLPIMLQFLSTSADFFLRPRAVFFSQVDFLFEGFVFGRNSFELLPFLTEFFGSTFCVDVVGNLHDLLVRKQPVGLFGTELLQFILGALKFRSVELHLLLQCLFEFICRFTFFIQRTLQDFFGEGFSSVAVFCFVLEVFAQGQDAFPAEHDNLLGNLFLLTSKEVVPGFRVCFFKIEFLFINMLGSFALRGVCEFRPHVNLRRAIKDQRFVFITGSKCLSVLQGEGFAGYGFVNAAFPVCLIDHFFPAFADGDEFIGAMAAGKASVVFRAATLRVFGVVALKKLFGAALDAVLQFRRIHDVSMDLALLRIVRCCFVVDGERVSVFITDFPGDECFHEFDIFFVGEFLRQGKFKFFIGTAIDARVFIGGLPVGFGIAVGKGWQVAALFIDELFFHALRPVFAFSADVVLMWDGVRDCAVLERAMIGCHRIHLLLFSLIHLPRDSAAARVSQIEDLRNS